jgi:hypothetical protein
MYSYEQFGLTADGQGHHAALYANAEGGETSSLSSALLGGPDGDAEFDRYSPFDPTVQIGWDEGLQLPFFWDHYTSGPDWRRVDNDWLEAAADMALRAGDFTNNISLVLAFELPRSHKVLLFVGDAQVGNWLSWHRIGKWRPLGASAPGEPANMDDLLRRVAFYKVGHHGSHNATIRDQGLEKMGDGLTAFIPVSVPVAHDIMGYCPMPFYPVLRGLQQKARGAVFLADGQLLEPLPDGADATTIEAAAGVRRSTEMLAAKVRHPGEAPIEGEVPLWIEFTLQD